MSGAIIEADGLTREFRVRDGKRRQPLTAVDGLTVRIEPGEAVGYIGANGAGKSTTIKMLTGILVPTAGSVLTCGLRPVPDRRRLARQVGVVFGQRSQLWWDLPVRESFRILAAIHALSRAEESDRTAALVEQLELGGFLPVPVRQLSLGQRMRAEVAAALLHSPRLVILDEPTIGLDVLSKQRLREFLVGERRRHGTTLLLTTHDMGDVERLCDRILVIDHGQLAYDGDLPGLSRTVGAERVLVVDLAAPAGARHGRHLHRNTGFSATLPRFCGVAQADYTQAASSPQLVDHARIQLDPGMVKRLAASLAGRGEEFGQGNLVEAGLITGERGSGGAADEHSAGKNPPARALIKRLQPPIAGEHAQIQRQDGHSLPCGRDQATAMPLPAGRLAGHDRAQPAGGIPLPRVHDVLDQDVQRRQHHAVLEQQHR